MWYYAQAGQQAGPLSKPDLQGMLRDGRLGPQTLVWREGLEQWQRADQVAELADDMAAGVPAGPVAQPQPGMPYSYQQPPTNGMALTSMILGICSIVLAGIFTAIPAVICGHIARRQMRSSPVMQSGEGMAITGLILGYVTIALTVVAIVIIILFFGWIFTEVSSMPTAPSPGSPPAPPATPSTP